VARAFSILSDPEAAEDVAQEVLIRIWQACDRINDCQCLAFARTLAKNLSLNILRSQKRHPQAQISAKDDDDDIPDILDFLHDDDNPHAKLEEDENQRIFNQAMAMLPYNWRTVLRLRNVEEMSFEEIAKVMATTESSVRGLLSKARMQMMQNIKKLRQ